ncbi:Hypothetical_protein [Hexamita inflata]|uniref:Hypothetical_protein n=1 Tax=Hexamita inflata TaxID=28002 RepID=A0AA86PV44_9EUKA|nr:Hypothetical protein HINF_LOCUS32367 [Hexamita inflata]
MNHNGISFVLSLICNESSGKIEFLVENYKYSMKLNQPKACLQPFLNDGGNPSIVLSGFNFLVLIDHKKLGSVRYQKLICVFRQFTKNCSTLTIQQLLRCQNSIYIIQFEEQRTFENNEFSFFRNKCQRLQIQLQELK